MYEYGTVRYSKGSIVLVHLEYTVQKILTYRTVALELN